MSLVDHGQKTAARRYDPVRAVIFDVDGVLVDAREWHYVSLNRALRLFGYEISRLDHLNAYDGLPTRRKLELLSKERGLPTQLHTFISELKQQYTMELITTECRPVFQREYALARLTASGIKVGVASNAIRASVVKMMGQSGLDRYIDCLLSNEDIDRPKPAPDIYVEAMRRLGVEPSETLVVEDNPNGVTAAAEAGAWILEVQDPDDVNWATLSARLASIAGVPA